MVKKWEEKAQSEFGALVERNIDVCNKYTENQSVFIVDEPKKMDEVE